MADKLTKKQEKFIEVYADTHNGTKAALEAYNTDSPTTAAVIASENLRKPNIIAAIEEVLPERVLLQVHREGLFASREIWKNNNATKKVEHVGDEADHSVRAKFLDMAYKLKGVYAPEKHAHLHVHTEPSERVKELARKLNK